MSDVNVVATAPADTKTRRNRGQLEADIKVVCDNFIMGKVALNDDQYLTPHRIGKIIAETKNLRDAEGKPKPPSTGAITNILDKWSDVGYIEANPKPFAFVGYTDEGVNIGLNALKERAAANKPKKAKPASKKKVAQAEPVQTEPVQTTPAQAEPVQTTPAQDSTAPAPAPAPAPEPPAAAEVAQETLADAELDQKQAEAAGDETAAQEAAEVIEEAREELRGV